MADTRVGSCGLGTTGAATTANVARAGYPLTVWVICISDTPAVESALFGAGGPAEGSAEGALARAVREWNWL